MPGAAVVERSACRFEPADKHRAQRLDVSEPRDIAIQRRGDRVRVAVYRGVRANQSDQVRHPHSGGEPLAADVAEREHQAAVSLFGGEKIPGQMTYGEDLARNVER